jgi:hypothetical protein
MGVTGRLTRRPDGAPKKVARVLMAVARFGLAARGLVLCAIGYYIIRAAEEVDATRVHTMGGTLRQVSTTPYGAITLGVLACGLAAYGVYLFALGFAKRRV